MGRSAFSKLFTKVYNNIGSEKVKTIFVRFKNYKRKKFIKTARKDISRFYIESVVEDVLSKYNHDLEIMNSAVFKTAKPSQTAAPVKKIRIGNQIITSVQTVQPAVTVDSSQVLEALNQLSFWDYYEEIMSHNILLELFGEEIFDDNASIDECKHLVELYSKLYNDVNAKCEKTGNTAYFMEHNTGIALNLAAYKATCELLK